MMVPAGAAEARPDAAAVGVQTVPVEGGPLRVKLGILIEDTCADALLAPMIDAAAIARITLAVILKFSNVWADLLGGHQKGECAAERLALFVDVESLEYFSHEFFPRKAGVADERRVKISRNGEPRSRSPVCQHVV